MVLFGNWGLGIGNSYAVQKSARRGELRAEAKKAEIYERLRSARSAALLGNHGHDRGLHGLGDLRTRRCTRQVPRLDHEAPFERAIDLSLDF